MVVTRESFKEKVVSFLKAYKFATPGNAIYLIVCVIITSTQLRGPPFLFGDNLNDFSTYYYSALELFQNPVNIYNEAYFASKYLFVFRYFPAVLAMLFYPLTALELIPAYILFSIISYILNLVNVYLVMEILRKLTKNLNQKFIEFCGASLLVLPFWIDFYVQGQISCILAFVLLLSMRYYLKGREVVGSLLLGFSLVLKPITFFQIIFICVSSLLAKDVKSMLKRGIFILIPLIPDALLFLTVDGLLEGFLSVNFATTSTAWFSVSFSNFFVSVLGLNFRAVFFTCLAVSIIAGILILRKIKDPQQRILFSFIFGCFGYFLTQIDIWLNQFPIIYPFLFLAIGFLPTYRDQKRFFIFYAIYPLISQFYTLYYFYGNAAIWFFIPVVSFSLFIMVVYYGLAVYRGNREIPSKINAISLVKDGD